LLPQAFYGVFDGHGGRAAVDFVSQRLGENVVSAVLAAGAETPDQASSADAVSAAIRDAYLATDSELVAKHQVRTTTVMTLTAHVHPFICPWSAAYRVVALSDR
jgi:protein phosphatase 1L